MQIDRNNNFDLIRLLAAMQVLLWHGAVHLGVIERLGIFKEIIFQLPGVPIFFTISGFLISYSLERSRGDFKKYFRNRFLRIYPALVLCTIFTASLMFGFGIIQNGFDFLKWIAAQLTFFQFYSPQSLKNWGVGHPNGSLWSIAVEIQFYLLLPLLFFIIHFFKKNWQKNVFLIACFLISIGFKKYIGSSTTFQENIIASKLAGNTVLFYLHFFITGIFIFVNFEFLRKHLEGKIFFWGGVYVIYTLIFASWLGWYVYPYDINLAGIIANCILSLFVISAAFSYNSLSKNILHENDISYGLYIYHMPIVNSLITLGMLGGFLDWLLLIFLTILVSVFSWRIVERKALKLK